MAKRLAVGLGKVGLCLILAVQWLSAWSATPPSLPKAEFHVSGADWYCGSFSSDHSDFASAWAALSGYTNGCPVAGAVTFDTCSGVALALGTGSGSCRYVRTKQPIQGDNVGGDISWSSSCSSGTTYNPATGYCEAPDSWQAGKNAGATCNDVGNPCNAATGNKHQLESDYQAEGPQALKFERRYSSLQGNPSVLGIGWRHNFDGRIAKDPAGGWARVERSNGQTLIFRPDAVGGWMADADINDRLEEIKDDRNPTQGWRYVTETDEVEIYDAEGRLLSVTNREGLTQTLSYSDISTPVEIAPLPGLLLRVTDAFGRALQFRYDRMGRLLIYGLLLFASLFFSIAAVRERSCSHISGLLMRLSTPLALMEYPRVFISITLSTSKAPRQDGFLKTPVRPFAIALKKLRNWVESTR